MISVQNGASLFMIQQRKSRRTMCNKNDPMQKTGLVHDGKFGWIVVIGAFFAHVITHGIVYSFGMMFSTLENRFHASKAEIAWIPSIMSGSLYLIGPLASGMINRYGCRTVTIIGAIIGFISYILSMFVSNLYLLYVTMGLIAGCGFGMVFLSAIIIVTQYFYKYRAVACGFGLSGAGIGAFVFSPLIEKLLDVYGFRGTLLILSAVILNCVVTSLAFKPLKEHRQPLADEDKENYRAVDLTMEDLVENHDDTYDDINRTVVLEDHCEDKLLQANHTADIDDNDKVVEPNGRCINNCSSTLNEEIKLEMADKINETIFDKTDAANIPLSLISRQLTLLKDTEFLAFISSQFLFFVGFYLPFIYIPGKAYSSGISEARTAWIGSTIGLSSVTGRIILGYVADRSLVDRYVMFKIALLVAGISTSFGPLLNHFWSMMLYAVIYGISTGITLSLTSVVLADLVGIHMVADAMGLNNVLSGLGSLLGPPAAGLLYDRTGSYTATFLAPGVAMTISGIILVLIGCRKRDKLNNLKTEYAVNEEVVKLK